MMTATATLDFAEDPCLTCAAPCQDGHSLYPEAIAKAIETKGALLGTMKPYKRHLMYCAGRGDEWPGSLEDELGAEAFQTRLRKAVADGDSAGAAGSNTGRTIVSAIDRVPEGHSEGSENVAAVLSTEVLLFPDFKALQGVTADEGAAVVSDWISKGALPEMLSSADAEIVDLPYDALVFVCVHKKRDKRCGVSGPLLIEEFNHVLQDMGLSDKVTCAGISHFGGHKYAGNIIIYSRKFPQGIWYGRVIPCHVENIVKTTLVDGKIFQELFRGQGIP
ncbi:Sucraseferredoxin-like protein [Chytriomyces cf. hyalinus JEL632]|nr:Sucraseferredoxin-like protein [Chytriomyces cf. hyalinus JEL632]